MMLTWRNFRASSEECRPNGRSSSHHRPFLGLSVVVKVWRRAGLETLEDDGTPQLPVVRTRISVAVISDRVNW
jgi:hypothetical protein